MNLFKLNKDLAVKLNQSFDTLYNLDYAEYSLLINILNDEADESDNANNIFLNNAPEQPLRVNLPDNLKLK
jgi:hypothetical protein